MTATREEPARRSVVPPAAGRSLWLASTWTGAGAAFVAAVVGVVGVAVCWLPGAGPSAHVESAIRAGLLTYLAALHGGVTVAGVHAAFVPLGLTVAVALIAWRAGGGLADAADDLDETDPRRLLQAAGLQAFTFAIASAIMAALATLGSSSVPAGTALGAAALLWIVTGTVAFVRDSPLADEVAVRCPGWVRPALRIGAAGFAVYLIAAAVLVAGSLVAHHGEVTRLSAEVGGGWSGVPVLILGVLAAPNAAIGGIGYLAGPGVAVGSGTVASLGSTAHGVVPAFPVLAALPEHAGVPTAVWLLVGLTPLVAGMCVAALARRADTTARRWRDLGTGSAAAAVITGLAAWLTGGGIGDGRLATVGVSPWLGGLAVGAGVAVGGAVVLGAALGLESLRATHTDGLPGERRLKLIYETLTAEDDAATRPQPADEHATDELWSTTAELDALDEAPAADTDDTATIPDPDDVDTAVTDRLPAVRYGDPEPDAGSDEPAPQPDEGGKLAG